MAEISKEDIEKFEKHLGKPTEIKIGEDTFNFLPLDTDDLPDLLKILKQFAGIEQGEEEKWLERMDAETTKTLSSLIIKTLQISYPGMEENKLKRFASVNFIPMVVTLFQINTMGAEKADAKVLERIKKIREKKVATENV